MTASYPSATPTLLGLYEPKNNILVETTAPIGAGDTSIPILDTSNLPASGYLTFTDGTLEIVFYTSKDATNILGVTRGADGSTAAAHGSGAGLEMRWNADYHVRQNEEIIAVASDIRDTFSADLDDSVVPAAVAGDLKNRLDMIVTQVKNITGETDWKTVPANTLASLKTEVDAKLPLAGGTMTGDITFANEGLGVVFTDSVGGETVKVSAPSDISASYVLELPTAQGAANTVLINDGSGNTSFGLIADANVDASAAILFTKLQTTTGDRVLRTNGAGQIVAGAWSWPVSGTEHLISQSEAELRFTDSGSNYAGIKAPVTIGTPYTITLENGAPAANTVWRWASGNVANWNLIENVNIDSSAAIQFSKMEALTANRLVATTTTGFVVDTGWIWNDVSQVLTSPAAGQFALNDSDGSDQFTQRANAVTTSYSVFWPAVQGGSDTFLKNDGAGNLTWDSPAGSGTVNAGAQFEIAYYPAAGTAVDGSTSILTDAAGHLNIILANSPELRIEATANTTAGIVLAHASQEWFTGFVASNSYFIRDNTAGANRLELDNTGNMFLTSGNSGGVLSFEVFNTQNVALSDAAIEIFSGGTSAGDPYLRWGIAGSTNFSMGIDNSESDRLVIAQDIGVAGSANAIRIIAGSLQWQFQDGTAAIPIMSFINGTNHGFYRTGTPGVGVSVSGAANIEFTGTQTRFLASDGTDTAPRIVIGGDDDTGAYRPANNEWGWATAGLARWRITAGGAFVIDSTDNDTGGVILAAQGAITAPSYSFNVGGQSSVGMSNNGAGSLVFNCNTAGNHLFYENGTEAFRYDGGANAINPGADNTYRLGTDPGGRWSDVRSVLINGADIGFANGWVMREFPCTAEDVQTKSTQWMKENAWKGIQILNKEGAVAMRIEHEGVVYAKAFKTFDGFDVCVKFDEHETRIQKLEKELKELKEAA